MLSRSARSRPHCQTAGRAARSANKRTKAAWSCRERPRRGRCHGLGGGSNSHQPGHESCGACAYCRPCVGRRQYGWRLASQNNLRWPRMPRIKPPRIPPFSSRNPGSPCARLAFALQKGAFEGQRTWSVQFDRRIRAFQEDVLCARAAYLGNWSKS